MSRPRRISRWVIPFAFVCACQTLWAGDLLHRSPFITDGEIAWFPAKTDLSGPWRLWRTDGSAEGTFQMSPVELCVGQGLLFVPQARMFNGKVLFPGVGSDSQCALFTAGSEPGSEQEIFGLEAAFSGYYPVIDFAHMDEAPIAVFRKFRSSNEVYRTDGTPEGTRLLSPPYPDVDPGRKTVHHVMGEYYYEFRKDGSEVWMADMDFENRELVAPGQVLGTNSESVVIAGDGVTSWSPRDRTLTHLLPDSVEAGVSHHDPYHYSSIPDSGGLVWFRVTSPEDLAGIWRTNGTVGGTIRVHSTPYHDKSIRVCEAGAFFTSDSRLWFSDGTVEGTHQVVDPSGYNPRSSLRWQVSDENLYVATSAYFSPLWAASVSSLAMAGIPAIRPGRFGFNEYEAVTVNGKWIGWGQREPPNGAMRLYATEGTPEGSRHIAGPRGFGSFTISDNQLAAFKDGALLTAHDPAQTPTIWYTDGTQEGSRLLVSLGETPYNSGSADLIVLTSFGDLWAAESGSTEIMYETPQRAGNPGFAHNPSSGFETYAINLNGDALTDLIHVDAAGRISSVTNTGNGRYSATEIQPASATGLRDGFETLVGDFSGNDLDDLLFISLSSGEAHLMANTDARFGDPVLWGENLAIGPADQLGVFAADMNQDGLSDVVFLNNASGEVQVALSSQSGVETPVPFGTPGFLHDPSLRSGVHIGNFNEDLLPDFAEVREGTVRVALNEETHLADPVVWAYNGFDDNPDSGTGWWVVMGDANGDTLDDLIQITGFRDVWVSVSDGEGFLPPHHAGHLGFEHTPAGPWQVFVGNLR